MNDLNLLERTIPMFMAVVVSSLLATKHTQEVSSVGHSLEMPTLL